MDFLVSGLEMAQLDQWTISEYGIPGRVLMETAGRGVAQVCDQRLGRSGKIAIACGTGNNGGDGFVAGTVLAAHGHEVRVYIFGDRTRIKGDAKATLHTLEKVGGVEVVEADDAKALWQFSSYLAAADLAIDALLGTGAHEEVRGAIGDAIDVLNQDDTPVVAVDLPSGVDADTGAVLGRAVMAQASVTFAFAKRGHYLYPGASYRGELTVVDIGIPKALAAESGVVGRLIRSTDGPSLIPARQGDVHKGRFGHLVVVAGSEATPGAALLALGGALRSGAGLVSWATNDGAIARAPALPPEVMLRLRADADANAWADRACDGATAMVIGPGWTHARPADLAALLRRATAPLCLDADALNLLAEDPALWATIQVPVVLTPHPKEMARLCGTSVGEVQRDRVAAALQLAISRSCVVVLKGAGTVVADPEGAIFVIAAGGPALATGGTGDVLAGVIGSLLAQGLDASAAGLAGALLHAAAGDAAALTFGQGGVKAGDVVDALGTVLCDWQR